MSGTPDNRPPWEAGRRPTQNIPAQPQQPPQAPLPPQPYPQQPYPQGPVPMGYQQPGTYPQGQYPPPPPGYPPQSYPSGYGYPMYAQPPKSNTKTILIVVGAVIGGFFLINVILALAAIPLVSANTNEAKSSEARAALGTIKDRLRVKFIQNDNHTNTSWRLGDLINANELQGKYYGPNDYSIVSLQDNSAVFRAAANVQTTSPQVTMTITNTMTGRATVTSP